MAESHDLTPQHKKHCSKRQDKAVSIYQGYNLQTTRDKIHLDQQKLC